MGSRVFPRSPTIAVALALCATVAVAAVLGTVDPWLPKIGLFAGGADLHVYRDGGWRVLHGLPLYGGPVVLGLLYTYTPFSALAFVLLERIPARSWTTCGWPSTWACWRGASSCAGACSGTGSRRTCCWSRR